MSLWHEKEKEDISFSYDGKEMHIYIESDDSGAIYVSVKVSDVKELLKKLVDGEETSGKANLETRH